MYKMFLRWHVFAKEELCHDYQIRMINSEVFQQVNFGIPTGNFRYYNRVLKSTFKMRCSIRDFFLQKNVVFHSKNKIMRYINRSLN
jgi:hypothetical protein